MYASHTAAKHGVANGELILYEIMSTDYNIKIQSLDQVSTSGIDR